MPPSSSNAVAAATQCGSKQLVRLGTRLVVGINLDGTLLHFPERGYLQKYRLRPFLRYFGAVLQKFHCDVALFLQTNANDSEFLLRRFNFEFGCPAKLVHEGCGGNFYHQQLLNEMAMKAMTRPTRVLMIDASASHTVNLKQTLVVEKYTPVKRLRGTERARTDARAEHKTVALTAEDYTLVALGEMIKEMASSDVNVADYLKMEPLVETVRVPMYGDVLALPMENCDHIEQLNLSALEVSEPIKWGIDGGGDDRVPDVKETEAHKDLFK